MSTPVAIKIGARRTRQDVGVDQQRGPGGGAGQHAGAGVGQIVVLAARVIDHILTGASPGFSFEIDQLIYQTRVVEQSNSAELNNGKHSR